jgi:hypothetical protein
MSEKRNSGAFRALRWFLDRPQARPIMRNCNGRADCRAAVSLHQPKWNTVRIARDGNEAIDWRREAEYAGKPRLRNPRL